MDNMKFNFECLEIQKCNTPTDRAQRVDKKNGFICLVIAFTPRVKVMKMLKNGSFLVFSADDSKKLSTVWAKYLSVSEKYY